MDKYTTFINRWEGKTVLYAARLLSARQNVIAEYCPACHLYAYRLEGAIENKFCPHCGSYLYGPVNDAADNGGKNVAIE